MNIEQQIVDLWEKYQQWLSTVKHIVSEDMGDDFASFMRWLRIYHISDVVRKK